MDIRLSPREPAARAMATVVAGCALGALCSLGACAAASVGEPGQAEPGLSDTGGPELLPPDAPECRDLFDGELLREGTEPPEPPEPRGVRLPVVPRGSSFLVELLVDPHGDVVRESVVVTGIGRAVAEEVAASARQWTFRPAHIGRCAVPGSFHYNVNSRA